MSRFRRARVATVSIGAGPGSPERRVRTAEEPTAIGVGGYWAVVMM